SLRMWFGCVSPATELHAFPLASQRSHWYVYAIGVAPVQVPVDATRVSPSVVVPVIVGNALLTGAPEPPPLAVTTFVAFESALAEPTLLDAVTRTRRRCPTSSAEMVRAADVSPLICAQLLPRESQRNHWYL